MRFDLLGPLRISTSAGVPVRIAERKVRALLAHLLLNRGAPVSADRLIEDLWDARLPANPRAVLRSKISQLRRALQDAEPGTQSLVASAGTGYTLRTGAGTVDADDFVALTARASACPGEPREQARLLGEALALWRGPALADFADEPFARAGVDALEERRLTAREDLAEARLELGEHGQLIGELGDLVRRHPLRERFRAAQMIALYRLGRQSEALEAYRQLSDELRDSIGVDPAPRLAALHTAILRHELPAAPVRPPAPAGRTNLVRPLTPLVGRGDALAEVRAAAGAGRLVTLFGPGGVGKTRLAVAAAAELAGEFPDGVWFVELATIIAPPDATGSPDAVRALTVRIAETVATTLGIHDEAGAGAAGGGGSRARRLAAALHERRILLVLDNCEHVVAAAAGFVATLLPVAARVTVLATSREPLAVAGERLYAVRPLELPPPDAPADPGVLRRSSAVELFVTRAAAAAPGFELNARNAADVVAICRRLDGIPLALDLAATRVRAFGVGAVADGLDDRFRLLTTGPRDAPTRQRTLQAAIDWSWELLGDDERAVLRRLAVHPGGATLAGAAAVCDPGDLGEQGVAELLARLVDRSMLLMHEDDDGPRYRLLESVLAYCRQKLRDSGEHAATADRHARHCTELAERADRQLRGPDQRRWLRRLDLETPNLRAALDHAVHRGDAALALRLTCALAWYWVLRGRLEEGVRCLGEALGLPGEAGPGVRATAQTWHAAIAGLSGRATEPGAVAALPGSPAPGTPQSAPVEVLRALARARGLLAVVTPRRPGGPGPDLVDDALRMSRELDDPWGIAAGLSTRAWDAMMRSDFEAVRRDGEDSLRLFRDLGDQWGMLHATDPLAALARVTGDLDTARRRHLSGLRVAEELGLWPKVAYKLCELGCIAVEHGDHAEADAYHEQARRRAAEQSNPGLEQAADLGLARSARRRDELDQAEKRLLPWLEWNRQCGWHAGLAAVQAELGFVAEQRGEAAAALARHRDGYGAALRTGDPRAVALALEGLAGAEALAGEHAAAARLLGAADTARASVGAALPGTARTDVERIAARCRAALGLDAFTAALEQGRALPPDACVRRPLAAGV